MSDKKSVVDIKIGEVVRHYPDGTPVSEVWMQKASGSEKIHYMPDAPEVKKNILAYHAGEAECKHPFSSRFFDDVTCLVCRRIGHVNRYGDIKGW